MTGYGFNSIDKKKYSIEVETKTLNSKFFDFNLKSNLELGGIENEIRNFVKNKLIRGKVEISININYSDKSVTLDKNKYEAFYKEIKNLIEDNIINDIDIHNNIFKNLSYIEKERNINISKSSIIPVLKKSIINCVQFREEEGKAIGDDIKKNIKFLKKELNRIKKIDKSRKKNISQKIKNKISLIKNIKFDKNRLEQEIFYFLERLDINEEITRLNKHLNLLINTIDQKKSIGKKLNFICQEIGREINTIGSKSSEFKIQSSVINMKEYLEKIKEENFNIL